MCFYNTYIIFFIVYDKQILPHNDHTSFHPLKVCNYISHIVCHIEDVLTHIDGIRMLKMLTNC